MRDREDLNPPRSLTPGAQTQGSKSTSSKNAISSSSRDDADAFSFDEISDRFRSASPGHHGEPFLPEMTSAFPSASDEKDQTSSGPSATIRRSIAVLWAVAGYAALYILAWTLICILTHRPLTTARYGVDVKTTYDRLPQQTHTLFIKNEHWLQAARVIQSIVSVLTIPLTSAVCSRAAVIFMQRHQPNKCLTLRQTMALADKGWTQPETYRNLLFRGWRKYASSFLILAIFLNILGASISPILQIFLSYHTIKTPTGQASVNQLNDISDQFNTLTQDSDFNLISVLTRNAITSTYNSDPQPLLWTNTGINCSVLTSNNTAQTPSESCELGGATLRNMSQLTDPFVAQLPSGYNTGLIRQFLPRFNSSTTREIVRFEDFPVNCSQLPGAFYVQYGYNDGSGNLWNLEACMPADMTQPPWKATRARQDFSEELYLNLTFHGFETDPDDDRNQGGLFLFNMSTTAGYFELPNYINGQTPGPLLNEDPAHSCGSDCQPQWLNLTTGVSNNARRDPISKRDLANTTNTISNAIFGTLSHLANKGPLLTIAQALFGDNSFLSTRISHPDAYLSPYLNTSYAQASLETNCISTAPLQGLLRDAADDPQDLSAIDTCLFNDEHTPGMLNTQLFAFVRSLLWNENDGFAGGTITNAFDAAAFLATQAWLVHNPHTHTLSVAYDLGADTDVPVISTAGIVFVSVLLVVYLGGLLAMALYSAASPRWTKQLDALAMMRVGASVAELLPLRIAEEGPQGVAVLDELPGWIGDVLGMEEVGQVGLGGQTALRGNKRYLSYGKGAGDGLELVKNRTGT